MLYSASPIDSSGMSELVDVTDVDQLMVDVFAEPESQFDWDLPNWHTGLLESAVDSDPLLFVPEAAYTDGEFSQEVVFVDANVEDLQELLDDLSLTAQSDRVLNVVLLDRDRDGVAQVTEALANFNDVSAVHLVSHGNESQLNLGSTTLTSQSLSAYAGEISGWRDSLREGADLLIYGCDLASSDDGRLLLEGLSLIGDCDVAASDDLTGHASLGGDWHLEYQIGRIETEVVFGSDLQNEWIERLTTFTVTSTADDGSVGTLRWAINQANTNGGLDTINFNIPDNDPGHLYYRDDGTADSLSLIATTTLSDGAITDFDPDYPYAAHSWFRIDLDNSRAQLTITDAVIIDGYSQSGASENTLAIGSDAILRIELTNLAGDSKRGITFDSGSNSSVLRGLAINEFGGLGVLANYNVSDITIQGNYIGTDITGTLDLGNGDAGIQIRSNDNLIGGSSAGDRNIISGSNNRGIAFFTTGTLTGNIIENNYIGVDATGLSGLGNNSYGIQLYDNDGIQIRNNVIADSASDGIRFLAGSNVDNSIIQGNLIGVGADGQTNIGNGGDGINLASNSANGNLIGGVGVGLGNVIAANDGNGILVQGPATSNTTIVGNAIGTDAAGLLSLGNNGHGVLIENGSYGNLIGGTAIGAGNKIAFNQGDGVALKSDAGNGNAILGNSIFENDELGIDLNEDNETDNDDFDVDVGANTQINYPVLTSAITDGSTSLKLSGWFNTTPGVATYRLEFFASPVADPGGNGEGQSMIGSLDVITNVDGVAQFNQTFFANVAFGEFISATATDSLQNTSEFSLAVAAGASTSTTNGIWMSTEGNVSSGGAPGLGDWNEGEVISFGGPSLELEPGNTIGSFASVVNLDLLGDGNVNIDAIHYVTQDTIVGVGINSINLLAGDVLISTTDSESFFGGTMLVDEADLFVYRPLVTGDYSIGTMNMVLDIDSPLILDPDLSFADMSSVTLVEKDVTIGGFDLFAGDILFTRSGGGDQDIYVFHVTETGLGMTNGSADLLIDGSALGINRGISGLDIVERSIEIGGETLAEGSLLISLDSDTDILDSDADPFNDLSVTRYDIISIDIARTEMTGGTAAISAHLVFEGADVNLDDTDENIDAFTIVNTATANVAGTEIVPDSANVDEFVDTTSGYFLTKLTNNDPDSGDTFTYTIVGGINSSKFIIGGAGADELVLFDGILDYERQASYTIDVRVDDSSGNTFFDTINVDVNDLNDAPVITSDGGGITAFINVVENTTAVTTVTSSDSEPDIPTYTITGGADSTWFNLGSGTGILTFISGRDFESPTDLDSNGIYEVIVTVDDGNGAFDSQTIFVTILDGNEVPTTNGIPNLTVDEDSINRSFDLHPVFDDQEDADTDLVYTIENDSNSGLFDSVAVNPFDQIVLDFADDQNGFSLITVRATDTAGLFVETIFRVDVNPVNDAPIGNDDSFSFASGSTFNGSGLLDNDTDVDDTVLVSSLNSAPADGTVTVNPDGSFVYVPGSTFTGTDSFTYVVNDGQTNSAPATVVVSIVVLPPPSSIPVPDSGTTSEPEEDDSDPLFGVVPPRIAASIKTDLADVGQHRVPLLSADFQQDELVIRSQGDIEFASDEDRNLFWMSSPAGKGSESSDSLLMQGMSAFDTGFLDKSGWFWQALDNNRRQLEADASLPQILLGSTAAITSSVTVGYLIWLIKGGQVMAALMANMPAWRLIDPLPILNAMIDEEEGDDDSLQTMIEQGEDELDHARFDQVALTE